MAVATPLPAGESEGFNFWGLQGWIRTQNKEARFCQKSWSRHMHVLAYKKTEKKKWFQTLFMWSSTLMTIQMIPKLLRSCPVRMYTLHLSKSYFRLEHCAKCRGPNLQLHILNELPMTCKLIELGTSLLHPAALRQIFCIEVASMLLQDFLPRQKKAIPPSLRLPE